MKTDEQTVLHLDNLTKLGQRLQVLKDLTRILRDKPSRALRPQLARIANRNHAYVLSMRILYPLLHEDREGISRAEPEVINTYATSLMWIGALEESQKCLLRINGSTDALLTEAFVFFAQWEYQKAIPVLLRYINSPQITPYQKLVGQTNLLAAYTATGNLDKAKEIFEPLIAELKINPNYQLLFGNCLELRAQIEILQNSYEQALEFLVASEKSLKSQPGRYLLYVNKWRAIAQLGLSPVDPTAKEALSRVKAEALQLSNWETLRDCDFHFARLTNDKELLQRILLGTPYKGYHQRIESIFGIKMKSSRVLEYCPGHPTATPEQQGLDLNDISDSSFLASTSWPLLQAVTKDIYRPPRMGVVFSQLYNQEYFNPFTSPQRVRNSVFRFNDWAQSHSCGFRIKVLHGDFHFMGPKGLSVITQKRQRPLPNWLAVLAYFKKQNKSRSFSSSDLANNLGISQRNALTLIQKALISRKIQKLGHGKNSRYMFFSGRRSA